MKERYTLIPGEPIIIYTSPPDGDLNNLAEVTAYHKTLLDQLTEPVFHIADMTALDVDLTGIMQLAGNAGFGEHAPFHHPMIREVLIVTPDPALTLAAKGLGEGIYGNIPVQVFNSVESALGYARRQK